MENVVLKEGKYIYCIIASSEAQSFGPLGIGGRGDELHTIFIMIFQLWLAILR